MDKSAIDTPSREIDLRNIPVHLRTALRRALEFEARAPAPRSAEEAEQCEEQLRVIADEFFGALLTPVLQRAVRSAAVGDAASALVRHLPRRMRSDGLETVNVRTSRGTTVPVTTPYYREKHARRAKRRPGLYPALVVLGIYDRCTPKLASDASRAVAMHSSLAEAQAQLRSDGIALDSKTLRSTAYRYAARARAAQQSAACGLLDRVTGKRVVVSLDGGRVRVRRKKRGPKTKKGRNRRVEERRVTGRVRWLIRRFRAGPQSESRRHVSSPRSPNPAGRFPAPGSPVESCGSHTGVPGAASGRVSRAVAPSSHPCAGRPVRRQTC